MLHLWLAALDGTVEQPVPQLSSYRAERLASVRAEKLRAQMLAAERLLVAALEEFGLKPPLKLAVTPYGKPFLPESGLRFSLSHTEGFAACAVADYEIGLDIQTPERLNERLARRFFTEAEQHQLSESARPDADFTALWCCKESYLKALGTGLQKPLHSFSVRLGEAPRLEGEERVRFYLRTERFYTLALCALDGQPPEPEKTVWL